ncbi:interferon alpha-inducible protein 27-like protein 2A isoform X2 [Pristis pectinata]|uniref:interferon alpha-inducible protein 27-like protein 2A isoform X2 n=1 Tax=Pristis pectinata TaxID=685728 RepID=UPI00223E0DEA|nr:interferon alpha-inducible protein 27-like protein 2A isoform X2 [Pristis pectinata]
MLHLVYIVLLLSAAFHTGSSLPSCDIDWSTIGWIAGGAAVAVIGTPVIVGLAGFTSTGITAGSIGAHLMSASAVLNGGGVASGGVVATLQSVGAAGFSTVGTTVLGTFGAVTGCLSKSYLKHSSDKS